MKIPKGHQAVMPYLIVSDATRFIDFTQRVFQAELTFSKMRENERKIMHAEIQINGSMVLFAEATEQWKPQTASLYVYVDSADDTYESALKNGASSLMPPSDQEYGRACGITDPTGNIWWITSIQ